MNVFPIVKRLQEQMGKRVTVGAAAELDAAMKGYAQPPAIYVVPAGEKNLSTLAEMGCSAGRVQTVSVITVVDELADQTGGDALRGLPQIRSEIDKALSGWTPDEREADPLSFFEGNLIQFDGDGRLWWADEYIQARFANF